MTNQKSTFTITVSGERICRSRLAGGLLENSCNLVHGFQRASDAIVFFFRYRSDARLVLRQTARFLGAKRPDGVDLLVHDGATARIQKNG